MPSHSPFGLWGSFFSRNPNKGFFKRFYSRVTVRGGELLQPEQVNRHMLQDEVQKLLQHPQHTN